LDTEVYSNTGGQASKSTPAGSIAKFAANGKVTRKKDLGLIAMSYKDVYVAQVAMGANPSQLIRALTEAESYNGPSLIIAYAPCINHGINLSNSQAEEKKAVETGYWTLYRYDPRNQNAPLTIDSAEPTLDYKEFLMGENRYVSLTKKDPALAETLFKASAEEAQQRRNTLKQMLAAQQNK
jgi:pyruvate-ferredoxin/flavodoxin oxidoreductase